MSNNILQFKKANCRSCYKCVRNCPVGAVEVNDQQAQIREEECILCEHCTLVCPQNAKVEKNQLPEILDGIDRRKETVISIHPSFLAEYGQGTLVPLTRELTRLGFAAVREAAEAVPVMRKAYEELIRENPEKLYITSHCPVVVQLVHKHMPELTDNLVPIPSVMGIHTRMLRQEFPDAVIVALMPCIASLSETEEAENCADYVITYQELQRLFLKRDIFIRPEAEPEKPLRSRAVVAPGGFGRMIPHIPDHRVVVADGLEKVMRILEEVRKGSYDHCLLDMYACLEGCLGGPSFRNSKTQVLNMFLDTMNCETSEDDFPMPETLPPMGRTFPRIEPVVTEQFTESQIRATLMEMDKFEYEDELNCGSCGYDTCREKAIAILAGKAEVSMCMPFIRDRQETYSDKIINAIPGMLVTVNYNLNIVTMNRKAQEFFCMSGKRRLIGEPVSRIMDEEGIIDMISSRKSLSQDQVTLPENGFILDRILTNDHRNRLVLCMLKDITTEMREKHERRQAQLEAAAIADKLMTEQLRIVHQIAGLLGETAADTKVAVEELKATIQMEHDV